MKNAPCPYIQYNSVMLIRILAQNPGPTFTRYLADPRFTTAMKDLLRQGRDPSVWQILCETLEHFLTDPMRLADEGLGPLREVWVKEKSTRRKAEVGSVPTSPSQPQGMFAPPQAHPGIPTMQELQARISEATTSASLLTQVLQSTPPVEIAGNELIREFVDRCKLAARSMQAYISADNPAPDSDTLTTLIETNDILSIALEGHKKAVASALSASETTGRVQNSRLIDIGDDHYESAQMRGAAVDTEHRSSSPVSPILVTPLSEVSKGT